MQCSKYPNKGGNEGKKEVKRSSYSANNRAIAIKWARKSHEHHMGIMGLGKVEDFNHPTKITLPISDMI